MSAHAVSHSFPTVDAPVTLLATRGLSLTDSLPVPGIVASPVPPSVKDLEPHWLAAIDAATD